MLGRLSGIHWMRRRHYAKRRVANSLKHLDYHRTSTFHHRRLCILRDADEFMMLLRLFNDYGMYPTTLDFAV